jgi:signal transduction histidine kinase
LRKLAKRRAYHNALKFRIASGFFLLGLSVSLLLGALAVYASAKAEDELVGEALSDNLKRYATRFYADRTETVEPLHRTRGLVVGPGKRTTAPPDWLELDTGLYQISGSENGRDFTYRLAVRKDPVYWFFLAQDITDANRSSRRVQRIVVGSVIIFVIASAIVGVWSAARVMRPVSDLARRVATLNLESPGMVGLAEQFPRDEVGQLAGAFDEYARRVRAVVKRDQEFNADVSHELRTPLMVVRSAAELLLSRSSLDVHSRVIVQRIQRAEQSGSDLISALLLLSRNERDETPCDVVVVAEQLVEAHAEHARRKGIVLSLETDQREMIIAANQAAVSVALGNLLSNAIRYTAAGAVSVRVAEGVVTVTDSGPGLSAKDEEHMFERGYRGSQAALAHGGGIGLSIVQRLCDLYGWVVELRNMRRGSGAVATLRFKGSERFVI